MIKIFYRKISKEIHWVEMTPTNISIYQLWVRGVVKHETHDVPEWMFPLYGVGTLTTWLNPFDEITEQEADKIMQSYEVNSKYERFFGKL